MQVANRLGMRRGLLLMAVTRHHLERVQEAAVLHQLRVDVVQLCHAHRRRLPHIWVVILCPGHASPMEMKDREYSHTCESILPGV